MSNDKYKVVKDNLDEYSVLRPDNTLVVTEIQYKATAELFCDELNELLKEIEQFKNIARDYNIPFDKLYDAFESNLNNDTTIALESQIATLKSENKRLENNIDELLRVDIISDLESEIAELKSENKKLNDNIDTYVDINADLETENSKLKQINYKIFQHIYNKLEEAFDKRVNAKSDSDIEYYKGYHNAIGDLKKEIVKELSDDRE